MGRFNLGGCLARGMKDKREVTRLTFGKTESDQPGGERGIYCTTGRTATAYLVYDWQDLVVYHCLIFPLACAGLSGSIGISRCHGHSRRRLDCSEKINRSNESVVRKHTRICHHVELTLAQIVETPPTTTLLRLGQMDPGAV